MSSSIKRKIIIVAIIIAVLLIAVFYRPIEAALKTNGILRAQLSGDYLAVLDVGEADAILVQSGGKIALIDTGNINDAGNALAAKLKRAGVEKIDSLVLTHIHTDHAGGLYSILSQFDIGCFYYTTLFGEDDSTDYYFSQIRKLIRDNGIDTEIIKEDMTFGTGKFDFDVLSCGLEGSDGDEVNDASVVLKAECKDVSFLLMADAGEYTERYIMNKYENNLKCDVLKVGHHGSSTSSYSPFLKAAAPRYAAISCGDYNFYGHPSEEAVKRLADNGADILRTDIVSDIYFYIEDNPKLTVKTEK